MVANAVTVYCLGLLVFFQVWYDPLDDVQFDRLAFDILKWDVLSPLRGRLLDLEPDALLSAIQQLNVEVMDCFPRHDVVALVLGQSNLSKSFFYMTLG